MAPRFSPAGCSVANDPNRRFRRLLPHGPFFDHLEDAVGADRLDELVGGGAALLVFGVGALLTGTQLLERAVEEAEGDDLVGVSDALEGVELLPAGRDVADVVGDEGLLELLHRAGLQVADRKCAEHLASPSVEWTGSGRSYAPWAVCQNPFRRLPTARRSPPGPSAAAAPAMCCRRRSPA